MAIAASAMFMLRAGGGHIYQIVRYHNVAPGNAGTVFYADFWLPAAGFLLLYLSKRCHAGIAD
ncbi:MAG: hypothetical protein H0X25_16805 [Acidobacteriales bacterium]|nr:hypothetical protein [Terriglobales bacterium]